jgi:hypothetical protein
VVENALAREETPGTTLFVTAGVEPGALDAFKDHGNKHEIMVLGIGTSEGGPIKTKRSTQDHQKDCALFSSLVEPRLGCLKQSPKPCNDQPEKFSRQHNG